MLYFTVYYDGVDEEWIFNIFDTCYGGGREVLQFTAVHYSGWSEWDIEISHVEECL